LTDQLITVFLFVQNQPAIAIIPLHRGCHWHRFLSVVLPLTGNVELLFQERLYTTMKQAQMPEQMPNITETDTT
jgi:hypothetical protein